MAGAFARGESAFSFVAEGAAQYAVFSSAALREAFDGQWLYFFGDSSLRGLFLSLLQQLQHRERFVTARRVRNRGGGGSSLSVSAMRTIDRRRRPSAPRRASWNSTSSSGSPSARSRQTAAEAMANGRAMARRSFRRTGCTLDGSTSSSTPRPLRRLFGVRRTTREDERGSRYARRRLGQRSAVARRVDRSGDLLFVRSAGHDMHGANARSRAAVDRSDLLTAAWCGARGERCVARALGGKPAHSSTRLAIERFYVGFLERRGGDWSRVSGDLESLLERFTGRHVRVVGTIDRPNRVLETYRSYKSETKGTSRHCTLVGGRVRLSFRMATTARALERELFRVLRAAAPKLVSSENASRARLVSGRVSRACGFSLSLSLPRETQARPAARGPTGRLRARGGRVGRRRLA